MKILIPFFAFSLLMLTCCKEGNVISFSITETKCNGMENPEGTGQVPVFSWVISSALRGQEQKAWQVVVSSSPEEIKNGKGDIWDSGKTISSASAWIPYSGTKLAPGKKYYWKVRAWDNNDKPSPWSRTGEVLTGLFDRSDWKGAKWIGYEEIPDSLLLVPGVHGSGDNLGNISKKRTTIPLFRKEFPIGKKISRAFVFVSGLGQYELYINGSKIGDRFLSPGWTDYRKTCLYNTYDVTEKLLAGSNAIGIIVGNGFYNISRERYRKLVIVYGAPKMILKLEVQYSDGSAETIVSDDTWKTAPSPLNFSSIYGGEDYDATREQDGWDLSGFNDT